MVHYTAEAGRMLRLQDVPPERKSATSSANETYSELLSLAAHEFRTPASVVGGYLRMLLQETESPLSERQRKMIEEADKSCGRLAAIVAELGEIAKLDDGTATVARTAFDLFPALDDIAGRVHESSDRDVQLQLSGEAAGAQMAGDLSRLQQAFTAVFRAVLREQPAGSRVVVNRSRVTMGPYTSALVIVAREDAVERARTSMPSTFSEYRGGMGLALPIARRVFERHGGRIWSTEPGSSGGPVVVSVRLQGPDR